MSLATIRSRAATILNGTTFVDNKKLRAQAYLTEEINTPQAEFDFEINGGITFGSDAAYDAVLVIRIYDQRDSARAAQIRLDELRDPHNTSGLKQLLENGSNWNGEVHYCQFVSCTNAEVVNVAGVDYLSIEARFGVTA